MELQTLLRAYENYGSPAYLFDADALQDRVRQIRALSGGAKLCFAVKANPFLVRHMADLVDRIEVCSPGELEICIRQKLDADKLLISGVNKTEDFIRRAMDCGVRHFTAESPRHMRLLDRLSRERETPLLVYPRLETGAQFGMDLSDLRRIVEQRADYPFCRIAGVHAFSGTQRSRLKQHAKELDRLRAVLEGLRADYGFEAEELEYGPGLYYPYFQNEPEEDLSLYARFMDLLSEAALPCPVTIEMGRYFTAGCGYYLTAVNDVKRSREHPIAILDGGIHQLNYYGGAAGMYVPRFLHIPMGEAAPAADGPEDWMLCGSLCTTADVIVRSVSLDAPLAEGDLLVFQNVGAYSMTEGLSLFLSRALPKVLVYENDGVRLLRGAIETYELNQ